jgi:hypothetical protein
MAVLGVGLPASAEKPGPLPKRAVIVDGDSNDKIWSMGNVKVTFSDGHSEFWTRQGNAMLPRVSERGLVGWTVVTADNNLGMHLDNLLRVCSPDGHHHDFTVNMPFIEKWSFSRKGTAVVLQFRGTHGPENFAEYSILRGTLLEQANDVMNDVVPSWAQALND